MPEKTSWCHCRLVQYGIVLFLSLFFSGCAISVNYVFKNTYSPFLGQRLKTSDFGFIILGDSIPGLYRALENDLSIFQNKSSIVEKIHINGDQLVNIEYEKFSEIPWNDSEASFAFIILQDTPKMIKKYDVELQDVEFEMASESKEKAKKPKRKIKIETYTTIVSVKCKIFLYDIENRTLLAKAIERFSIEEANEEVNEYTDRSYDPFILGFVQNLSKQRINGPSERIDEDKFPEIDAMERIDAYGYFLAFLRGVE